MPRASIALLVREKSAARKGSVRGFCGQQPARVKTLKLRWCSRRTLCWPGRPRENGSIVDAATNHNAAASDAIKFLNHCCAGCESLRRCQKRSNTTSGSSTGGGNSTSLRRADELSATRLITVAVMYVRPITSGATNICGSVNPRERFLPLWARA